MLFVSYSICHLQNRVRMSTYEKFLEFHLLDFDQNLPRAYTERIDSNKRSCYPHTYGSHHIYRKLPTLDRIISTSYIKNSKSHAAHNIKIYLRNITRDPVHERNANQTIRVISVKNDFLKNKCTAINENCMIAKTVASRRLNI